ncbi:MAG: hypothetical protein ACYTAN_16950 [Planctomycetota bacterium]
MKSRVWSRKRIAVLAAAVLLFAAALHFILPEVRIQLLIRDLGSDEAAALSRILSGSLRVHTLGHGPSWWQ